MELLEFKNVSKSFFDTKKETQVLKGLNFKLANNEKIALVGPSGCGKSTILNLASGLLKEDEGNIIRNGNIGYMFQVDNLFEWITIYKNITLGLEIKGKIDKKDRERILMLLEKYGLKDFKDKHPSALSGGMRQRVG
jgi:NitT/TauT family transport system ATP-binding protein